MHYVPILDAGVAKRAPGEYPAYDSGHKLDLFIKIKDGEELIGKVWPGDAVYPDFFHNETAGWWSN
jgi:alpha-glucosidase